MRVAGTLLALSALAAVAVACASDNQRTPVPSTAAPADEESPSPSSSSSVSDSAQHSRSPVQGEHRIQVTIGDESFEMTLDDSAASRDLVSQLPVTLEMRDHGSVEKTGRVPRSLSVEGQPAGADPDPADVGYYAPGNDLVFYYGDAPYYPGIVVIGRMERQAAERIGDMPGTIIATVSSSYASGAGQPRRR